MKQNVIEVAVSAAPETPTDTLQAGKMYEHNATALCFVLEETLVSPEYRYYAEFVTVSGVARTAYLTPNTNGKITVELPVEVTSQMTALCVLNVVKISGNGKTEQVIKAKTVRLYFSSLENTDKMIDENHTFSVNQLLEAIQKNTFKGDKGDKGDAYILTDADKTDIAAQVNEAFYGLPLQKYMSVCGQQVLSSATDGASVSDLTVRPITPTLEGVKEIQIAVGNNLLSEFLHSERYSEFSPVDGNYSAIPLCLKPETEYILAKRSNALALCGHSYLKFGTYTTWFCHKSNANLNSKYRAFTVPADGQCALYTTYIYLSKNAYQQILDSDWEGLTLMEKNASLLLQKNFSEPLYAVGAQIGDSYDFVSGTLTRRTAKAQLTSAQLCAEDTAQINGTVYRYKLCLPSEAVRRVQGCRDGLCAEMPTLSEAVTENGAWEAFKAAFGKSDGIWFGAADDNIYVFSERTPADFAAWLGASPLHILYASVIRETADEGMALTLPRGEKQISITPNSLCADIRFSADISSVIYDFESRLKRLENTI